VAVHAIDHDFLVPGYVTGAGVYGRGVAPVRAATPMSIMVGVGKGAQHGVLIRDAEALERMEKVDTLVVDKTGTLTEGRPKVVELQPAPGFDAATVLQKLASVERSSEHPLAAAIVADAQSRKLALSPVTEFDSPLGKGVVGVVDGAKIVCGSASSWPRTGSTWPACKPRPKQCGPRRRQ
jgi:P-type E1-E2 ATPase